MNTLARVELIRRTRATVLLLHAELRPATGRSRPRKPHRSGQPRRAADHRRRRAGRLGARRAAADRIGLERPPHRPRRRVGDRPLGLRRQGGPRPVRLETEFIAEFRSLATGGPAEDGELAELVLTSLGRIGSPVIRYRTGDIVRPRFNAAGESRFALLEGGVLGRADDMLIVRGVNIFPSSVEQILRAFPEVVEYRVTAVRQGSLDALLIEIEDRLERCRPRRPRAAAAAGPQGRRPLRSARLAPAVRRQRQAVPRPAAGELSDLDRRSEASA